MEIDEAGEENRYLHGRNGDNLINPFQCDLCHFRNLKDRDPDELIPADQWTLKCIRRANLDALWATEPPTVARNASELRRGANIALSLGIKSHKLFKPMGPFPLEDSFGMAAAIVMLSCHETKEEMLKRCNSIQLESSGLLLAMRIKRQLVLVQKEW